VSDIPAQVAHRLKCKNADPLHLQFTGHILSTPNTDEYKMEYQCPYCHLYVYEIKTRMELGIDYDYPTDKEWEHE